MNFDLISSISRYILREESRGKEEIAGHGRPPCITAFIERGRLPRFLPIFILLRELDT
jgi:hypothetical protein